MKYMIATVFAVLSTENRRIRNMLGAPPWTTDLGHHRPRRPAGDLAGL
jgi:hypothetical protein